MKERDEPKFFWKSREEGAGGKCNLKFYKLPKNWRERQM
jgi:hypothetical protein